MPKVQQRPRRMLARRSAAKILMRNQDFRVAVRVRGSARNAARSLHPSSSNRSAIAADELAEPAALDGFQKPRRNDLIGVHIGQRQAAPRCAVRTVKGCIRRNSRTSARWPVIGGGRGHRRRNQVRAPARPLAAFEIAVRCAGGTLARRPACPDSWPGTLSTPAPATRNPLPSECCPGLHVRPAP